MKITILDDIYKWLVDDTCSVTQSHSPDCVPIYLNWLMNGKLGNLKCPYNRHFLLNIRVVVRDLPSFTDKQSISTPSLYWCRNVTSQQTTEWE